MSVTIKKIAELSGVSRGTVDRVLNNRGKVRPETEKLVRQFAEQLGYKPNVAGKALAARKKTLVLGILLASQGNPFYDEVIDGIRHAEEEFADYGLKIRLCTMRGYNADEQLTMIDSVANDASLLIVTPVSTPRIAEKINELTQRGVPVITLNTDIENSKRLCYVGSDYRRGGETACGMMSLLTGGKARVGIVTGSLKVLGHNERIIGFHNVAKQRYPHIEIIDCVDTEDDDIIAFEKTKKMLTEHRDINAIFIVAAGVYGVCRAILSMGFKERMTVVCFDQVPTTIDMMRQGVVKAAICQEPFTQGYQAVRIAFDYLVTGEVPEGNQYIVKNEINILESL